MTINLNMLGAVLTGGANLAHVEAAYEIPSHAQRAFRDFAMNQMKGLLSGGSVLSVLGEDGSVMVSDPGMQNGTYGRYVFLADKGELAVWKEAHGVVDDPYPEEPRDPAEVAKEKKNAEFWAARDAKREANKPYADCMQEKIPFLVDGVRQRYSSQQIGEATKACRAGQQER